MTPAPTTAVPPAAATARSRRPALLALVAASLLAAACGGASRDVPADSLAAAGGAATGRPAPVPLPGDSLACPEDGQWRLCSVVKRLEDAGLVPQPADEPVRHPFFSVPGAAFRVARGDLEVFLYDDAAAAARDAAALDTVRVAPPGEIGPWPTRPAFVRSANLIAVYVSVSETQIERVQLALGAGPPQAKDGAR